MTDQDVLYRRRLAILHREFRGADLEVLSLGNEEGEISKVRRDGEYFDVSWGAGDRADQIVAIDFTWLP